ncbi:MAG: type I asparaginase [Bacteroidetes bacterium]|nr:type I asparaginase [Bacteroidota bacterium]
MIEETSILIIYTGGTIGMIADKETGALVPFNFDNINNQIPELKRFNFTLDFHCFEPIMDSSNMDPVVWIELGQIIKKNYEDYDGFVILHGSDTMAYTASAMSFILENLNKPVVFTGSQLPLGVLRTDGRENLITSIEIAAAKDDDTPIVPEVCVYFENHLMRANRSTKYNAENFNAFVSGNLPLLADVGIYIKYNRNIILKPNFKKLKVHEKMVTGVAVLKLFPGISKEFIIAFFKIVGLKGVVMESFGSGNAPSEPWFVNAIEEAIDLGVVILNVTQCITGAVEHGKYETSVLLEKAGVIGGGDITTEAALTKLMYLFGKGIEREDVAKLLRKSLRGELTIN